MPNKKVRSKAHRRDRRKAKASNWRRAGKTKFGVVGHGANGSIMQTQQKRESDVECGVSLEVEALEAERLRHPLINLGFNERLALIGKFKK